MKIKISILVFFLSVTIFNTSCKNNDKSSSDLDSNQVTIYSEGPASGENVTTTKSGNSAEQSDCDKFLSDYENYSMEYIRVFKRYASDPTNQSNLEEFSSYSQKTQQWSERWKNLGVDCVNDPSFSQKYLNITNKITDAATKMYQ